MYNPLKAKYAPEGREDLCRTYLGEERTLRDLKKHVVLTSFKLDGKVRPKRQRGLGAPCPDPSARALPAWVTGRGRQTCFDHSFPVSFISFLSHSLSLSFSFSLQVDDKGAFIQFNGGWRPSVFSNVPKLTGVIEPDYDLLAWDAA